MATRQKFERRNPQSQWTLEKTYQRRSLVDKEIAECNRAMNVIDKHVKHLVKHVKEVLKRKVANKWRYRKQLELQIKEIKENGNQTRNIRQTEGVGN